MVQNAHLDEAQTVALVQQVQEHRAKSPRVRAGKEVVNIVVGAPQFSPNHGQHSSIVSNRKPATSSPNKRTVCLFVRKACRRCVTAVQECSRGSSCHARQGRSTSFDVLQGHAIDAATCEYNTCTHERPCSYPDKQNEIIPKRQIKTRCPRQRRIWYVFLANVPTCVHA